MAKTSSKKSAKPAPKAGGSSYTRSVYVGDAAAGMPCGRGFHGTFAS